MHSKRPNSWIRKAARELLLDGGHLDFWRPRSAKRALPGRMRYFGIALLNVVISTAPAMAQDGADGGATPTQDFSGPVLNFWNPTKPGIAYLFAGYLKRTSDAGALPFTVLTVGAQINAANGAGVDQSVFGIATEAWAMAGSSSMLTGIEASVINLEPNNPWRKISVWSTFKNRPDVDYFTSPSDPMNMGSQAFRIESQPGTGYERGVVFAPFSLHQSRHITRPVAIDFAEVPLSDLQAVDIMRFPDGCALVYLGRGRLGTRCDQ